ncbi:UNVERIFIED_CONTAM: hypothetical protein HDU68_002447 [Siphonaria sp. JEL0065]|nr:hypothetical protein HDU68_002447 [Siphonaria sp. JEL0065]
MKDISGVAKEITAISTGSGPTNWAILGEDSTNKSIKILDKGVKGLAELRQALQKSKSGSPTSDGPSAAVVGYVNHNNIPLKIRMVDSKSSLALSKNHNVKVLLKQHVAVVDVKDVDNDLTESAIEKAVENLTPVSSPVQETPVDEIELEGELNRAFEEQLKVVETLKLGAAEKLNRHSQGILEQQKETLSLQIQSREKTDAWKKTLASKAGPLFEGWLAFKATDKSAWKAKWAIIDDKKLSLYRDEIKSSKPVVISLVQSQVNPLKDEGALKNSFEIKSGHVTSGATFYAENKDLLFRINAAVELSA